MVIAVNSNLISRWRWTFLWFSLLATVVFSDEHLSTPEGPHIAQMDVSQDAEFSASLERVLPAFAGALLGFVPENVREVPPEHLPADSVEAMRSRLRKVFRREVLGRLGGIEAVAYSGRCNIRTDACSVNADFDFEGMRVLAQLSEGTVDVCIRVNDGVRIDSNPFTGEGKRRLVRLAEEFLVVSYGGADEVECHGGATDIRGVTVYTGQMNRVGVDVDKLRAEWKYDQVNLFDRMYVLLTISDPQYIYFRIGFPDDAKSLIERPRPLFPMPGGLADQLQREEAAEPDVAQRYRFVRRLHHARLPALVFDYPDLKRLPKEAIDAEVLHRLRSQVAGVLNAQEFPPDWEGVQVYALGLTNDPNRDLRMLWTVPAGEAFVMGGREKHSLGLRFKLTGEFRVQLYPANSSDGDHRIDTAALYRLLTTSFRFPFRRPEDFKVRAGPSGVHEGVYVFTARIQSNDLQVPTRMHATEEERAQLRWYDDVRILVTDSDPQYVGLVIDLETESSR